jgi:hypothetical protein
MTTEPVVPPPETERCGHLWQNRSTTATHARHVCQAVKPHTYHKCHCSVTKRNPHPELFVPTFIAGPVPDLRTQIKQALETWEEQCGEGYRWTSVDVADFVECNVRKFVLPPRVI